MADGAWLPDGTFRHLLYFDAQKVERLFRAEVLRMLLEKGRIDADTVNNMLSGRTAACGPTARCGLRTARARYDSAEP